MSTERLTFLELLDIGAAVFELLVATIWRMPAAVVANIAGLIGRTWDQMPGVLHAN